MEVWLIVVPEYHGLHTQTRKIPSEWAALGGSLWGALENKQSTWAWGRTAKCYRDITTAAEVTQPTWEEGAARSGVWAASSNGPGCVQVVDGVGMRLYGAEHTLVPDLQLQTGVWASCSFGTRGRDLQFGLSDFTNTICTQTGVLYTPSWFT